ncbi:MAG TPA: SH3 domain-containing protein [Spirochaetia bacterium]|nr:SH3 domain-containing protein [Spirochaetia bacterium]
MKARFLGLLLLALTAGITYAQSEMSVTVKETQVRERPSFLAKVLATVQYGDRLTVLGKQSGWVQVQAGGQQGWVSASALTEKKIVFQAGSTDVSKTASSGEVALAGRGFNKEVESKYATEKNLDYSGVDRIERYGKDTNALIAFMQAAKLHFGEGGN